MYLRYAKFEQEHGSVTNIRDIYERAIRNLPEPSEEVYLSFAKFEESQREWDRARTIYKYALEHLPKSKTRKLYQRYVNFEKQRGDRGSVEEGVLSRKRLEYEESVKAEPHNYDAWMDYIRLEESNGDRNAIREVYERAIGNVPPIPEKRYWERYIYLWINFALYEELEAEDLERTREVYRKCLEILPHDEFTFPELWIMLASFELRRKVCLAVFFFYFCYFLPALARCFPACRFVLELTGSNPHSPAAWTGSAGSAESDGECDRPLSSGRSVRALHLDGGPAG